MYQLYKKNGYAPVKTRFSFYCTDKDRTLVFAETKPKGYEEFERAEYRMTIEEALWVEGCRSVIEREEFEAHEKDYAALVVDLLDRFEDRLKEIKNSEKEGEKQP